jgi:hypothetical protein
MLDDAPEVWKDMKSNCPTRTAKRRESALSQVGRRQARGKQREEERSGEKELCIVSSEPEL